ncbi:MAG TPA: hypothetical protein VFD53_01690 [Ilumatobacter sp.]|nr:hypothetical protein [Ilumatobacter sp.]
MAEPGTPGPTKEQAMSISDQPKTSHPTRTGVIAGLSVALAVGAALTVATWDWEPGEQTPGVDPPSYAEQMAALSDEQLAAAFNYNNYPVYEQIAALSDEELAGAFNYTDYAIPNDEQVAGIQGNMPVTDEAVNHRIAEALAAGDLDLSASFAFGDAAVYSGNR